MTVQFLLNNKACFFCLFLSLFILFSGCKSKEEKSIPPSPICLECKPLFPESSKAESIPLYQTASFSSSVLETHKPDDPLLWTGKISQHWDLRKTNQVNESLPWFEVLYSLSGKAWVHGSQIDFDGTPGLTLSDSILVWKRASTLGNRLAELISKYQNQVLATQDPQQFAKLVSLSLAIQNELAVKKSFEDQLDPEWVQIFGHVWLSAFKTDETFLFKDFKAFNSLVLESTSIWDNAALDLFFDLFPEDSIEYDLNVFDLPLDQQTNASILGQGTHQDFLKKLENLSESSTGREENEIAYFLTEQVLNDLRTKQWFWESKSGVLEEFNRILAEKSEIIRPEEKLEIEVMLRKIKTLDAKHFNLKLGSKDDSL